MNCPECGAADAGCDEQFNACLVKEFEDPNYGVVHHLTVTAYMIQHSSKLTKEGWLYERQLLHEFLVDKKPPAFVRKEKRDVVDSGKRTFKIKDKSGLPKIGKTVWTRTILDVRIESAEVYCDDINAWAMAVLGEAEMVDLSGSGAANP